MYTIFVACIVASVMMLFIEWYGMKIFAKILKVPRHILLPIVFVLCVVGAFGLSSRVFDVWAVAIFGVIGYFFAKFKVPQAPFVIGFVLGSMAETNFRRGLMMSDNNFLGFVDFQQHPISAAFLVFTFLYLLYTIYSEVKKSKKRQQAAA